MITLKTSNRQVFYSYSKRNVSASAWRDKRGFFVTDKESEPEDRRYRIGFDRIVTDIWGGGGDGTKSLILATNIVLQDYREHLRLAIITLITDT